MIRRLYALVVIAKATAMAIAATLLDLAFWKALLLVCASAFMTGLFALAIAYVQLRHERQLDERLARLEGRAEDVAVTVGAPPATPPGEHGDQAPRP